MAYDKIDFLLDRANIHDVITKLLLYVDTKQWDKLGDEVIAHKMILDYTLMFGGEPQEVTAKDVVAQWQPLMESMDATQHTTASLLITLPQPGAEEIPQKATVVANVMANLIRSSAEDGPRTSNGGRYEVEVTREMDDPNSGGPWRISRFKSIPVWYAGNRKVLFEWNGSSQEHQN